MKAKKQLISIKELSEITGISVGTLYNMKAKKTLPFAYVKIGTRTIKFDIIDVENWIEKNKIKPEKMHIVNADFDNTVNGLSFSVDTDKDE